jgi:prepilin-type N-terminal cleavage/methylation domain-containing protein
MEIASIGRLRHRPKPNSAGRAEGFSLLEMMMVVTLILIVASIATPIYQTCAQRAREAVLRDHLFTLRALIDRFTLDNGRAPLRLEELVEKGYLGRLPTDPFTGPEAGNREQGTGNREQATAKKKPSVTRDGGRSQRPRRAFPRRHSLQQLVSTGFRIQDSGTADLLFGFSIQDSGHGIQRVAPTRQPTGPRLLSGDRLRRAIL